MFSIMLTAAAVAFQPAAAASEDGEQVLEARAAANVKASGNNPDEVVCKSAKPTQGTGSRLRRSTGKQICRKRIDWEMDELAKDEVFRAINENEGTGAPPAPGVGG